MRIKQISVTGMFIALIAVGAWLSFPIGPVAITLQTLFIMVAGLLLTRKYALTSVLAYLLLGFIGLPIFAGGIGGLAILARPSLGFLLGFFPLAYFSNLGQKKDVKIQVFYLLIGNLILYLIGFFYMYIYFNFLVGKAMGLVVLLQVGVLPYLPGDLVKLVAAIFLTKIIKDKLKINFD